MKPQPKRRLIVRLVPAPEGHDWGELNAMQLRGAQKRADRRREIPRVRPEEEIPCPS